MTLNRSGNFPSLREVLEKYNGGTPRFVEHDGKLYDSTLPADQVRLRAFAKEIANEPKNKIRYAPKNKAVI